MIEIEELHLSIPGNNREDGADLGRMVADRLADAIPENYGNQHIPEIRLQLQSESSNNVSLMADSIAEQIIRQIKLALR